MELYLLTEILNEVLNGRNTSRRSKVSFGTEASQSDSFLNVRYWVGHLRKTDFLMRAQRWKNREKRHSLWNSDIGISYES